MKAPDIKAYCAQLEERMKEKLDVLVLEEMDLVARAHKALVVLASLLQELKEFVSQYQFEDQAEEIHFFKRLKPLFLSQYFFYARIVELKTDEPSALSEGIQPFYLEELERIQKFMHRHAEFIHYCLSESTHMDDKYFVRGFVPEWDFVTDRTFSTLYDERMAQMLGCRLVKEFVVSMIESQRSVGNLLESSLVWTGSKADLIELIYGLETMGVINKGAVDIKEIARRFESLFNVSLGNVYRQFIDIRLRKKDKTTFLNEMKYKLEMRIDDFR